MKTKLATQKRKSSKQDREHQVLLGLVDYYLKTGKPVGSNTLKSAEFEDLSSATIRNYFAHLEELGFLHQEHASGGRIPTHSAYRTYIKHYYDTTEISPEEEVVLDKLARTETKEITDLLQEAAELISKTTQTAVFISAPRFDQDFITKIHLTPVSPTKCVAILVSDFGVIHTEVLQLDEKLSTHTAHRFEQYFHWRLTGEGESITLPDNEKELAKKFYNELMLRYVVDYANFTDPDIHRTGFSTLLHYPDFQDTLSLASSLSLFENAHTLRLLLRETLAKNHLQTWVGNDLSPYTTDAPNCSIITIPYHINKESVGAIGLLGPTRLPYKELFGLMRAFSASISHALTKSVYKFKITYRQPQPKMLAHTDILLLEDKNERRASSRS